MPKISEYPDNVDDDALDRRINILQGLWGSDARPGLLKSLQDLRASRGKGRIFFSQAGGGSSGRGRRPNDNL